MNKSGHDIQSDMMALIYSSDLVDEISGGVYRKGLRPRDSRLEDIIVVFTAGFAAQIQTGIITIDIYVPDIEPYLDGVNVENGLRLTQLEKAAADFVRNLTAEISDYKFTLQQAIASFDEPDIKQHFVCIKLKYDYYDGNEECDDILITEDGLTVEAAKSGLSFDNELFTPFGNIKIENHE